MDDLSTTAGPLDGLSAFIGRSFARRGRKTSWQPHAAAAAFAELVPSRVVAEHALSHRALAMELTEAALEHYLDLSQRLAEVRRRHESHRSARPEPGFHRQSLIAEDEGAAWERWLGVIESSLRGAEAEVVAVVRAWDDAHKVADGRPVARGVIHRGSLYLAVPSDDNGSYRLSVIDLRSSLNLDGSLAVIDVVKTERLEGPRLPITPGDP